MRFLGGRRLMLVVRVQRWTRPWRTAATSSASSSGRPRRGGKGGFDVDPMCLGVSEGGAAADRRAGLEATFSSWCAVSPERPRRASHRSAWAAWARVWYSAWRVASSRRRGGLGGSFRGRRGRRPGLASTAARTSRAVCGGTCAVVAGLGVGVVAGVDVELVGCAGPGLPAT